MGARIAGAVSAAGLREYYDPYSGEGMGAEHFSWSSLVMEFVEPDPLAHTSHVEGSRQRAPSSPAASSSSRTNP
jgi:hypothetical protein